MSCDPGARGLNNVSKPNLRGHGLRSLYRTVYSVCALGAITAILFRLLYVNPRRRRYEEFRKNVDMDKEEERITALGWFDSGGRNSGGKSASEGDEPDEPPDEPPTESEDS